MKVINDLKFFNADFLLHPTMIVQKMPKWTIYSLVQYSTSDLISDMYSSRLKTQKMRGDLSLNLNKLICTAQIGGGPQLAGKIILALKGQA